MKLSFVKSLLLGTALTCATASFAFAEDYNWSGIFIGGTAGATDSSAHSTVDYGSDLETAGSDADYTVGWRDNGAFTGALHDDLLSLDLTATATQGTEDTATAYEDIGSFDYNDLQSWVDVFNSSEMNWSATAILGGQIAADGLVFGAEMRGTFGNFDTSTSEEWNDSDSAHSFASCATDDRGGSGASCTINYDDVGFNVDWNREAGDDSWTIDSDGDDFVAVGYEATYGQQNSLSFGANYDRILSPVAKLGFAAGRIHLFAMGGPAWAKVTAVTSAHVGEEAHVDVFTSDNDSFNETEDFLDTDVTAVSSDSIDYDWSGSNTETIAGYSVGGGMEWAATDNLILRVEGLYTDLGDISVTGTSLDTDATYTVTQELTSVSGSAGMLIKF